MFWARSKRREESDMLSPFRPGNPGSIPDVCRMQDTRPTRKCNAYEFIYPEDLIMLVFFVFNAIYDE
jgi:hypothetical protein